MIWARRKNTNRRWHIVTEDEQHEMICVRGVGFPDKYAEHYDYVTEEPNNVCRACDPSKKYDGY